MLVCLLLMGAVQPMLLLGQAPAVFDTTEKPNETELVGEIQRLDHDRGPEPSGDL